MSKPQRTRKTSVKDEPDRTDVLCTFDEFLQTHAEAGWIKEYNGFYFTTSKQAPRFNGKNLYLDVHSLQLLKILAPYYTIDNNRNLLKMLDARGRKRSGRRAKKTKDDQPGHPSLRAVDYFFTNFSKICHVITDDGRQPMQEYDRMMDYFTKQRFDMFSRRFLLFFRHPTTELWVCSSVRQLNFFKFYLESGMYEYIKSILPQLQEHMSRTMRHARQVRQARKRKLNEKGDVTADAERRRVPLIKINAKNYGVLTKLNRSTKR